MSAVLRARAALLALAAAAALSLAPGARPAAAWDSGASDEESTPAGGFIRRNLDTLLWAVPAAMAGLYVLIMGPADAIDALFRTSSYRYHSFVRRPFGPDGFGEGGGGFGGDPFKNPWE